MRHKLCLLAIIAQISAFYPVWLWYGRRILDGSDEPYGLLALVTAILLVGKVRNRQARQRVNLFYPGFLTLLYSLAYLFLPPLGRALAAMIALGSTLRSLGMSKGVEVPLFGLLALSLPVIASAQFYFGYPLRLASGHLASLFLNLSGYGTVMEGTLLRWGVYDIAVDAPCSGIRMLWVGFWLTFTAAGFLGMDGYRTFAAILVTTMVVILGNSLRSAALFHLETGLVGVCPPWMHEATGSAVFLLIGVFLLWFFGLIREKPA